MFRGIRGMCHANSFMLVCGLLWMSALPISTRDYRLAYMTHASPGSFHWPSNVAAIYMAIDQIESEEILGRNNSIKIVMDLTACGKAKHAMGAFVRLHELENIDGFLGIGCSTTLIYFGYLGTYWNLPMLSQSSQSPVLADGDTYPTLVRLLPAGSKLGLAMKEIISYFGWKKLFIFADSNSLCTFASDAVFQQMSALQVTVVGWVKYNAPLDEGAIVRGLSSIMTKSRVIFLCGRDDDEVRIMLRAHELNMTSSDYVYLTPVYRPFERIPEPWLNPHQERREDLQDAMRAVIQNPVLSMPSPSLAKFHPQFVLVGIDRSVPILNLNFQKTIQIAVTAIGDRELLDFQIEYKRRMAGPPWYMNNTQVSTYAPVLYDSMYLYALAVNKTLQYGDDPRDGRQLVNRAKETRFYGMSGYVALDENADRQPTYSLFCLKPGKISSTMFAEVVLSAQNNQKKFRLLDADIWRTADGEVPADTPTCGFRGELCEHDAYFNYKFALAGVCFALSVAIVGAMIAFFVRRRKCERELQLMLWRINYLDLQFMDHGASCTETVRTDRTTNNPEYEWTAHTSLVLGSPDPRTPGKICRGQRVHVKRVRQSMLIIKREDQIEFQEIKRLNHENINPFVGACVDWPNVCMLFQHCARGSLQDILADRRIILDNDFKDYLIFDIIKGMAYIHDSPIRSHGKLKSSNCLLDSRWVLKITDFDPCCLQHDVETDTEEDELYKHLLWTAPEMLRDNLSGPRGTPEADVYSFGIILQEIVYRALPFFSENISSASGIIRRVRNSEAPPYRPQCPTTDEIKADLVNIMKRCWDDRPKGRPRFNLIRRIIEKSMTSVNIMEHILYKLETYSGNLEETIRKRTEQLAEAKETSDVLLYQMLPRAVADRLKKGESIAPEYFDAVTIYFSNVVDFASMSAECSTMEVIEVLNSLYAMIDTIVKQYDVYKVETIGDAYMVVSGLQTHNELGHVREIADMALNIMASLMDLSIRQQPDRKLELSMGIHTGPCCAGVVGLAMPRYCLFGDTVNTASRMESHGAASRIHVSEETVIALRDNSDAYIISVHGTFEIKGKGIRTTYWLDGKAED